MPTGLLPEWKMSRLCVEEGVLIEEAEDEPSEVVLPLGLLAV